MSSLQILPPELYPTILQYASITDLKSCALVNSFFQNLAQPRVFSSIRMVDDVDGRLAFFNSERGRLLVKYTQSLVLGSDFWTFEDQDITTSFLRALDGSMIHTLHVEDQREWEGIPKQSLHILYSIVMPRLRSLCIDEVANIPLIMILSHCPLVRHVELGVFSTSSGDSTIDFKTLPQIRSLTIVHWDIADLATSTSLGKYLKEKGSSIESLSLEIFVDNGSGIPCTMDLFPTLKPCLRQIRFDLETLEHLVQEPPLRFNELAKLESLYFTVDLRNIPWAVFYHFLDQHIEQDCFPSSLKNIHLLVLTTAALPLDSRNSEEAGSGDDERLALPANWQACLYVGIHIDAEYGQESTWSILRPRIEEYIQLQQALESWLWKWSQADRLIITHRSDYYMPW